MGKGHKKKKSKQQQQQQQGLAAAQEQQVGTSVAHQQQQQRQDTSPQQPKTPPGPPQQPKIPPGPPEQQKTPPGPPQQQKTPPGPPQQQKTPPGPPQQQKTPPGPPQQQKTPLGPPQQQKTPPGPQHQQQSQWGPQKQQQGRGISPHQQQGRGISPHQQQSGRQEQQRGPWGSQQQQRGRGISPHQQQSGRQEQQRGPWGSQQQQQTPPGPQQQQRVPWGPQQQQQTPPGPQQQQRGPWGSQQQQQTPPGPQQQQRVPWGPQKQQQISPSPQQLQQTPPGFQQPQQVPPGFQQHQQMLPSPQQQQQMPPDLQQQQETPPRPQQEQTSQEPGQKQITTYRSDRFTVGKLTSAMQDMYLEQIPKRKSAKGGVMGRPIIVETNMLKIILDKLQTHVVHYDVIIEPDKPKFLMRPVFEEYRKLHFPSRYPAFDGKKNAYSAKELPFGDISEQDEVKVYDVERQQDRPFKVYLKRAAVIDLSWLKKINFGFMDLQSEQSGMQALEIILKHGSANTCVSVGRSLFPHPEPGRVVPLSNGLDLWVGIFQSAVIGWRPYLNVDVVHKGFTSPQMIIDLMKEMCKHPKDENPLEDITPEDVSRNADKITKYLKGLKIQYEIPGQSNSKRRYRVNGLVECPRQNKFTLENGQECTVENYFIQQKRYRLQYPELPCLWVGSRSNERRIHLPAELCTIVAGQVIQRKMDGSQTSKLIRYASTDTQRRKEKIMHGFKKMKLNEQPTLSKEFNLSVNCEFEKVPARVLEAPVLEYKQESRVNVIKGVWRATNFRLPTRLADNEWTILNLDKFTQERTIQDGLHIQLRTGADSVNMHIGKALTPFVTLNIQGRNLTTISQYFAEKKRQNLKLIVVIIPNLDNAYSLVKQISELRTAGGIVTQVLKAQTLKKLSQATITNILLKINSKLNGINHQILDNPPCLKDPYMLVGADVTHPSPDSTDIPSIAAVAASYNANAFQYKIELRLQPPREEMIQDLETIMRIMLSNFHSTARVKPTKIIFYRDGVSEGQLPQVMHYELSAIKRAIAKMGNGDDKIPITFLVVQKRHHIRLFPTDRRNSDDRNFNVQAGTVVDTNITHPTHIDFYLVSHASIQGTARPTKYRCICNESDLSEDEIEQLTYYLCHMFARCTRSVSYPAPTYYAHLAAFRARALIHGVPLNINNLEEEQRVKMSLQMKDSPMFFV
ncbi:protein argonaute-2-like [Megalopta genalis]|uniref:protein argonaute-2-like n=1 Tax=Megalopta genalis TaxID=115081 RepID=UPI003FD577B4